MISDFCLPFDALTKHTFSTKLTKRQGRREQGTMTSHCPLSFLPSMLPSTGSTPQHVIIPPDVTQVRVRAHDLVDGYGGREVLVDLTVSSGPDFEVERTP
jgi:hypothetical protein